MPKWVPSGGDQLTGDQSSADAQNQDVAGDQQADRQPLLDAHTAAAVGSTSEQDPATTRNPTTTLQDPALALAADVLDDLERVRTANENRLRQLTRSVEDSDGKTRGFGLDESHPDVARLAAMVETLKRVEHDATLNLQRLMRRHPLGPWVKTRRGIGEKQVARLLATIGDPYIRPEFVREDGTVTPEDPRTVSALWAYCGLNVLPVNGLGRLGSHASHADDRSGGDPSQNSFDTQAADAGVAPKRQRGQRANWSTNAKTRAYLIATSCLKQLVKPCTASAVGGVWLAVHEDSCACSAYRVTYDARRMHTASTRPDWTDGHSHNDALRVASKEILKDLWRAARDHHLKERAS